MLERCQLTFVSDSCHSGGLIDGIKEQIGESTRQREEESGGGMIQVKSRFLPLPTVIEMLKEKTGKDDIKVGKLRPTLFDVFGDDASPKVKKFVRVIMEKLHGGGDCGIMAEQFLQQRLEENDEEYLKPAMEVHVSSKEEAYAGPRGKALPDEGILISGCQMDQTSSDVELTGSPSDAYGALSNAIQSILAETEGKVSNYELVTRVTEMLASQGFTQRPGLYCSDQHVDAPFVC